MSEDEAREQLLAAIDRYLDVVPRIASRVETIGPLTLFVSRVAWPYYARPTPGRGHLITSADVRAVAARQRVLRQPVAFEWVRDLAPGFETAAREAGLRVQFMPLLALSEEPAERAVTGVSARVLAADDEALPAALAAVEAGFRAPGTSVGPADVDDRDRWVGEVAERASLARELIRDGQLVYVAAEGDRGVVGAGSASPRGEIAELMGIATLPAWRRRGIGALVAAALTRAVRSRGVMIATLSAGSEDIARVYRTVGFTLVGSVGEAAEPL
jgi:GNAT superfamily N-acetyltransferase